MPTRSAAAAPTALGATPAARSTCARICRTSTTDTAPAAVDKYDACCARAGGPQLTFQPLHLLAQRRLHDVLPLSRPAEMQLLGQRHEIAKLT